MIKVKLIGDKKILSKLESKLKRIGRLKNNIFASPIDAVVKEIKQVLASGSTAPQYFNHIYTKNMYRNTRKETQEVSTDQFDFNLHIKFGYFVPYGILFEEGQEPHLVPLATLEDWIKKKKIVNTTAKKVQKAILKRGTIPRPIIKDIWYDKDGEQKYKEEALKRFIAKWR